MENKENLSIEDENPFPEEIETDEKEKVFEFPSEATLVGSKELEELIKQASQNQVTFELKRAKLLEIKRTGEPECYAQMVFHKAIMPWLSAPSFADMRQTRFDHTNLIGARFDHVNLKEASFREAYAPGFHADHAEMEKCNIMGADFTGGSLVDAKMNLAKADHVILNQVNLSQAVLTNANIRWGKLNGAFARGAKFMESNFAGAHAEKASFIQCDFTDANFSNIDLTGAFLEDCTLPRVDMALADLTGILVGRDSDKAYNMLQDASWYLVRRALFLSIRMASVQRGSAIAHELRKGNMPEPLWKMLGLSVPKKDIQDRRMERDPLLIAQLFLNALQDVKDARYNKYPFVRLINEWFDEINKVKTL